MASIGRGGTCARLRPGARDEQPDRAARRDAAQVVRLHSGHDDDPERLRVRLTRERSREET